MHEFIQFHTPNGSSMYFRADTIVGVIPDGTVTILSVIRGAETHNFFVVETPQQVFERLKSVRLNEWARRNSR